MARSAQSILVTALLAAGLAAAAAAQPVITGIQSSELPRSGRVAISGSGFGSAGEVFIAGLPALTTTWTGSRVVAYVPEAAPLGSAPLYLVVGGEQSNEVALTVTARQPQGRVRWTFEADSSDLWYRPALAPDGTLYLHCNGAVDGFIYALSPDGALLWIQTVDWYPYAPPTAGPDGTLYVGSIYTLWAISNQGEILWQFEDPSAQGIQVAPTVGPDGSVYGGFDLGIGAFALDAASGALQWSNRGDPPMHDYGSPFGTEVLFGPSTPGGPIDQLYMHQNNYSGGPVYAFSLDGDQRFATGLGGDIAHEPVLDTDGRIYAPSFAGSAGWAVQAIDPSNGQTLWIYDPANGNGMEELAIGPDDTLYVVTPGHLEAVDAATATRRWLNPTYYVMDRPSVTPDGTTLVLSGVPDYGDPGFVKAFSAATGEELWTVGLPGDPYPGFRVLGTDHPRITPDGATAYVSTFTVADGSPPADPRSYLFAIELDPTPPDSIFSDGFESGDTSAWSATVP
ncbi:MAG: PQQ-binding-like beta-propeller repeat protein [Acidobacteriota bacterium]|nr:PQQ-binding-like beta-propeller repeat protein [Acidobacteriota bacterium]MDH3522802.1 PQQ-binding-like beta-propeller repeat protein [Acidobacteriota bacterium]